MAEKDATVRLRRAVKENNLFIVKRLIQRTDMRNPDPAPRRYTSLAWAAVLGHEETFEYLMSSGHDDAELSKDSENNTILMILADQNSSSSRPNSAEFMGAALRMARMYYDRYPDILDWSNVHGRTALHTAALKGHEELARMLCDFGADVDLSDNKGNTPLHYASSWGHIAIVQLLVERGCLHAAKNNDGFTASDYAYSFSTKDTLQDTVRLQFENNKKTRRAIFAQAAARANGHTIPTPTQLKARDVIQSPTRMRSGSGTSRTTTTSDSGEVDSNGLAPGNRSQSSSSSPSNGPHPYLLPHAPSSSNGTYSTTSPSKMRGNSPFSQPPPASTQSPVLSRMRERDAEEREKYYRTRSGSQGTASTSNADNNHRMVLSFLRDPLRKKMLLVWRAVDL
ncbi:unnamed protein product [Mycena citricolor]|uniref:Ankyrin n=1 Tax=Mycena citricolor TaxID=2018698 RepID=A0AAD2K2K2_9AGAR|nr:unnamed protein product [Mycena citricolor]